MNTIMINGKPVLFICDQACAKSSKKTSAPCFYTHDIKHALWRGETTLIEKSGFYLEDKPIAEVFDH